MDVLQYAVTAMSIAALAVSVTRSSLARMARAKLMPAHPVLAKLLNCPFCMAHWFALPAALVGATDFLSCLILFGAYLGLATIFIGVMTSLLLMQQNEIDFLMEEIINRDSEDATRNAQG